MYKSDFIKMNLKMFQVVSALILKLYHVCLFLGLFLVEHGGRPNYK